MKKHNPTHVEMLLMLDEIDESITSVASESDGNLIAHMRASMHEDSMVSDAEIMDAINEWREIHYVPVVTDIESDIAMFVSLKGKAEVIEGQIKDVRTRIHEYVTTNGTTKTELATASLTKASTRVTYDAKMLDSLMATMVANGHHEYAEVLSHARKETTGEPSLLIKRNKE